MNGTGGKFDTTQMLYEMLTNSGYIHPTEDTHGLGKIPEGNAAKSPISSPEKASTIANSFGDGLYGKSNYSPEAPSEDIRTIRIEQINFGENLKDTNDIANEKGAYQSDSRVIERWELINPIITNISWGSLDYSSDDLVECTLDIKYDWAEYSKAKDATGLSDRVSITNNFKNFSKN